ncbi:YfiR/HmsC family protein [Desulfococcaceae bacterium HSG9]|nr:YfiR/HmsC family protein [Desulfococcaceae bacterium HSG9]
MRSAILRQYRVFLLTALLIMPAPQAYAGNYGPAPEKLQAALFVKILAMSKEISSTENVSIHVINASAVATQLRKAVGRKIGKSVLAAVNASDSIPAEPPTILYIGADTDTDKLVRYCRQNGVLSITGIPRLVKRGVTLGVGLSDNKPIILLNISSCKAEKITWNPTLLKLSIIHR